MFNKKKFILSSLGGAFGVGLSVYHRHLESKMQQLELALKVTEKEQDYARADVQRFKTWGTTMGHALEELGHADRIPMVDWS